MSQPRPLPPPTVPTGWTARRHPALDVRLPPSHQRANSHRSRHSASICHSAHMWHRAVQQRRHVPNVKQHTGEWYGWHSIQRVRGINHHQSFHHRVKNLGQHSAGTTMKVYCRGLEEKSPKKVNYTNIHCSSVLRVSEFLGAMKTFLRQPKATTASSLGVHVSLIS